MCVVPAVFLALVTLVMLYCLCQVRKDDSYGANGQVASDGAPKPHSRRSIFSRPLRSNNSRKAAAEMLCVSTSDTRLLMTPVSTPAASLVPTPRSAGGLARSTHGSSSNLLQGIVPEGSGRARSPGSSYRMGVPAGASLYAESESAKLHRSASAKRPRSDRSFSAAHRSLSAHSTSRSGRARTGACNPSLQGSLPGTISKASAPGGTRDRVSIVREGFSHAGPPRNSSYLRHTVHGMNRSSVLDRIYSESSSEDEDDGVHPMQYVSESAVIRGRNGPRNGPRTGTRVSTRAPNWAVGGGAHDGVGTVSGLDTLLARCVASVNATNSQKLLRGSTDDAGTGTQASKSSSGPFSTYLPPAGPFTSIGASVGARSGNGTHSVDGGRHAHSNRHTHAPAHSPGSPQSISSGASGGSISVAPELMNSGRPDTHVQHASSSSVHRWQRAQQSQSKSMHELNAGTFLAMQSRRATQDNASSSAGDRVKSQGSVGGAFAKPLQTGSDKQLDAWLGRKEISTQSTTRTAVSNWLARGGTPFSQYIPSKVCPKAW